MADRNSSEVSLVIFYLKKTNGFAGRTRTRGWIQHEVRSSKRFLVPRA